MLKRTVVCQFVIAGTPAWVAETLRRSAILPDKERLTGIGRLAASIISDETEDVPGPPPVDETFTREEILQVILRAQQTQRSIEDLLNEIERRRY